MGPVCGVAAAVLAREDDIDREVIENMVFNMVGIIHRLMRTGTVTECFE